MCSLIQDQDQMSLIDLRDASRERACIDDKPHTRPRCLHGCVYHRVTQTEVVDDDVHQADPIPAPRRPAQASLANAGPGDASEQEGGRWQDLLRNDVRQGSGGAVC
jgi:hypothetical protein